MDGYKSKVSTDNKIQISRENKYESAAEEIFHAFQESNSLKYNKASRSDMEAEAHFASSIIMDQVVKKNYYLPAAALEIYNSNGEAEMKPKKIFNPKDPTFYDQDKKRPNANQINSSDFNDQYQKWVDEWIAYNQTQIDMPDSYKQPSKKSGCILLKEVIILL